MDLGILVDASSVVDWSKMQGLLKGYVGTRNISFDGDHVGIVYFASSSQVALPFPTSSSINYNKNRIWQAIDDLKQQGGDDRRIDLGLEAVATDLFGPQSGARRDANRVKIPFFCRMFVPHFPVFRLSGLYLTIWVLSLIINSNTVFCKLHPFVYSFQTWVLFSVYAVEPQSLLWPLPITMGCCYLINLLMDIAAILTYRNMLFPSTCYRSWPCLQQVPGHLNTAKTGKKQRSLSNPEEWIFMRMVSNQEHKRSNLKASLCFPVTATC